MFIFLQKWREQFGDIFSIFLGSKFVVVLNGTELIRNALVKMADNFTDRPHMFLFKAVDEEGG